MVPEIRLHLAAESPDLAETEEDLGRLKPPPP
jgi:hypothetical protein